MHIFVCDNYDSFTFNLVQYLGALGARVDVARNDETTVGEVASLGIDAIVVSPGPGTPDDAGISIGLVEWCARTRTPLLGVCLGLQAIGAAFGVPTVRAPQVMHGKTSLVEHDGEGVLRGLASPMQVGRYHSLVLDEPAAARALHVSAHTLDGVVMGARHRRLPIEGVQFHPESVLTPDGHRIVENFVRGASAYALPT